MIWTKPQDSTIQPDQPQPAYRYLTVGGAIVEVYAHHITEDGYRLRVDGRWHCLGCDKAVDRGLDLRPTQDDANEHAGLCRALPKTT